VIINVNFKTLSSLIKSAFVGEWTLWRLEYSTTLLHIIVGSKDGPTKLSHHFIMFINSHAFHMTQPSALNRHNTRTYTLTHFR